MSSIYLTNHELNYFNRNYTIIEVVSNIIDYNTVVDSDIVENVINNDTPLSDLQFDNIDTNYESTDYNYYIEDIKTNQFVYQFKDPSDAEELKEAIQSIISKDLQKSINQFKERR